MSLFVSIASYRDPELEYTISDLLKRLSPESDLNIRIVILDQNTEEEYEKNHEKFNTILEEFKSTIKLEHYFLIFTNAKGPVHARYLIQKYYANETYYMQIDSHTRFLQNWDNVLINMLNILPNKSIITQYPPNYKNIGDEYSYTTDFNHKLRSGLYIKKFGPEGFTRITSDYISSKSNYPYTSRSWAACFSFSLGDIINDAPYINYEYLFFGEELDITLRLYTKGYNFFSPNITVVNTYFNREYRRTYWKDVKINNDVLIDSRKNLKLNLFDSNYLGNIRSLSDYENFSKIDLTKGELKLGSKSYRRN